MNTPNHWEEHQLLFCIARRDLDADATIRLRDLLTKSLDWEYLQEVAFDQGLFPLLALHVISHGADLLPDLLLEELRAGLVTNRQSNLYLARKLIRVLSALKSAGIDALAFKGPILGQLAYEDIGLRQTGDLDILIHLSDFHRAAYVLSGLAYNMGLELTSTQAKARLRYHCEILFRHEDLFSVVDLHWAITPTTFPLALTADDFLANRKVVCLAGHIIETFSDEDLVLYLSVNAAKDYFRILERITTIAEFIRSHSELSWADIRSKARAARAERILCLALMLVESLYKLPVAPEFADLAGSTDLKESARMLQANLLTNTAVPNQFQAFRWHLHFMSKRDAYLSLLRAIFVPTLADWEAVSVPDAFYPVYYLLRPIRLLTKYGSRR